MTEFSIMWPAFVPPLELAESLSLVDTRQTALGSSQRPLFSHPPTPSCNE